MLSELAATLIETLETHPTSSRTLEEWQPELVFSEEDTVMLSLHHTIPTPCPHLHIALLH